MNRYATGTTVSVEKSKAEIERTLIRYGATEFAYGTKPEAAMVGFKAHNRQIRFFLPLPAMKEFRATPGGRRERNDADTYRAWEQACRQRWRALALAIKAKLEAVESLIATFEDEFLAYTVLPGGQTIGEWAKPQIEHAIKMGIKPPPLMLMQGAN